MVSVDCKWRQKKSKSFSSARRSRNQRQDLCTTEARRHGEKQKINGSYSDRRVLAVSSRQSVDISNLSPQQKDEGTEKQSRGLDFRGKIVASCEDFHD